jgi:ATP:ADP antiporter, AAA family
MQQTTTPWLQRMSKAQPHELRASLWAFAYFFCVLASYYVLRPIRDEMANQLGRGALAELFTYVFVALLIVAPLFGWLTSKFPRKQLLPWLYGFFALNLVGFFFWMQAGGEQSPGTARVFYVWTSVYNLFVVSVFWSFMADLFDTDQAKRLYGFIAAGGTAGALVGPLVTSQLVTVLGPKNLMLVSAGFLLLAVGCIGALRAWEKAQNVDPAARARNAAEDVPMGGSIWAGLRDVVTNPYLLGICFFLFAYSLLSTLLYFHQVELLPATIKSPTERTQLLARVDLVVNIGVLLIQVMAFGTLMRRLGTRFMLVAMPVVSVLGFMAMAYSPALATLLVFGVVRRAGEYAVSKPARETLFNVLPAEQKYKAKNVIDTLVHRTGDWLSTLGLTLLNKQGMTMVQLSMAAVPVALGWWAVAHWLGGQAQAREADRTADAANTARGLGGVAQHALR